MSAGTASAGTAAAPRLADYVELTKPRITLMVVLTAAVGYLAAGAGEVASFTFLHAIVGTALLAASATALNQLLERDADALMRRTAGRPLPTGRVEPEQALRLGVGLGVLGLLELAIFTNLLTAAIGALTLASYVFVYTPLKRVTSLSTLVGAVPGALPPVMGWTAARDSVEAGALALFGVLFLWQLPHFLAIAWLYRADYERGGFPMLPVLDPSGQRTARLAVLYAAALVPVSLLPSLLGIAGGIYFVVAAVCGLAFLGSSLRFARALDTPTARVVLFASIIYLPVVLLALVVDRLVAG